MSNDSKPLVSIVMPAYNSELYIAESLDSALAQTYTNWEMIVVDDGSKDGTADIIKKYAAKDPRIKYVFQENKRMAAARNTAIALAKGKYVAFLDNDDLFLPDKLAIQVAYLEEHPDCGICYANMKHFFDGIPNVFYRNRNERVVEGDAFRWFLWRNSVNVLQVVLRRELFDKWGAFRGEWPACDEQYVWANFGRHGVKFCHLEVMVGLYRERPSSDSHRKAHIFYTSESFLKMLDLIEPTLSAEEREKYQGDFDALRKRYKRMLFIGRLMKTAPFSWILFPLYQRRRDGYLTKVDN